MAEKSRSYEVRGERYYLPPASLVKTINVTNTGNLDTWPAHATGRFCSSNLLTMTKNKRLLVVNEEEQGRPNVVPKPRFLEQLEGYLNRELRNHGVTVIEANSVRLQIHREVFEYLIEAFKTYKPLLSSIKREYEMMLAFYREEIRKMEPMKEMLWTLSQECDRRVIQLRDEEKDEITDLKKTNKQLQMKISAMQEAENDLVCQVEKLQDELAAEHQRYRDECDSRKLLVSDVNELRAAQEDMLIYKQNAEQNADKEDPVKLRIALHEAKRAQVDAVAALNKMIADYSDVIPRREFVELTEQHAASTTQMESTKEQLDLLQQEHKSLMEVHDEVLKQRNEFYMEVEGLRRYGTPRPNWVKCAEFIYGGMDRWKEIAHEKSSNELVDILLREMVGGEADDSANLTGKGVEDTVPKFLRFEGQVQNRKMTKRDCRIHIREVWDERKVLKDEEATAKANGEDYMLPPFGDFLDLFFRKVYGIEQIRIEWAYSFYDALARFQSDEKISQFRGIVDQTVDEEVYWEEMRIMGTLLDQFKSADSENRGALPREEFKKVLVTFYTNREEATIDELMTTATNELSLPDEEMLVEYERLFLSDDEGEFGPLLKEVRRLLYEDKAKYIEEIKKELVDLGVNRTSKEKVDIEEVRKAIAIVDPQIEQYQLDDYLCWGFGCSKEELEEPQTMEIAALMARLNQGNVKRVGSRT